MTLDVSDKTSVTGQTAEEGRGRGRGCNDPVSRARGIGTDHAH